MSPTKEWVRVTWLVLLLCLPLAASAAVPWRVSDARVVLSVALDGSMLVRETLTVAADVSHGTPFRDLPLSLTARARPTFDIEVLQVSQAGQRLPWQTEAVDGALRVHLGSPRRRIPPGTRTYELLYHVDGQLAASSGREWLLWRPVGADLAAEVSRLEVTVTFARVFDADRVSVELAGGGAMERTVAADGTVTLTSTAALAAGEGPALLVGWPRGHLLVATDSETDAWMQPRATSLWWGVAGALLLVLGVHLAGRASAWRGALPLVAAALSLVSLYAAGAQAARQGAAFPAEFVLALAGVAFAVLARDWLRGAALRVAYIVVVTAIAATVTVRWTLGISPWYPLLVMLHADLLFLVRWRARRSARKSAPREAPAPTPPPAYRAPATAAPQMPVLDRQEPFIRRDGELLPDGRRVPYFDTAGGRAPKPPEPHPDGISPPRAAGRRRPGASAPRTGRVRRY